MASNRLVMSDGSEPIAWVDAGGNVLPVEKYQPLSFLPNGARYLFTPDEVREAMNPHFSGRVVVAAAPTADVTHVTGEIPSPQETMKPAINRGQLASAFDSATGSPAFQVR